MDIVVRGLVGRDTQLEYKRENENSNFFLISEDGEQSLHTTHFCPVLFTRKRGQSALSGSGDSLLLSSNDVPSQVG